jgi:hypothetical protein
MSLKRILCASFVACLAGAIACGSSGSGKHTISGKVTGASSVTVSVSGASVASVTTDDAGSYSFSGLADGSYTVTPSKDGFTFSPASLVVTVNGADETGKDFTASPVVNTYAISGKVTGASGVRIDLGGANTGSTTSDSVGNYSFSGLADGSYTLTPVKDGYAFDPPSITVALSGANATGRDFTATLVTHVVSGTVSGATGDAVTVVLTASDDSTQTATTDTVTGAYSFTAVPGSYTVAPSDARYTFDPASLSVAVTDQDVTGNDFAATRITYRICGTVSGATGQALSMALSGAATQLAATDTTTGAYCFTGLLPGGYTVTPGDGRYTFDPASLSVTVADQDVMGRDFAATLKTYAIAGIVSNAAGAVVTIEAAMQGGGTQTVAADGTTGAYVLTGLIPGSYTLTPSALGYTFSPASLSVTITDAGVAGQDFVAILRTYVISGTVTGASGVTVTLTLPGGGTTTATASPSYSFSGLGNGDYTVTPSSADFTFSPESHAVTVSYADVPNQDFAATPVIPTYAVSGTVTEGAGSPMVGATVVLTDTVNGGSVTSAPTGDDGAYSITGVVDGQYRLTPYVAGRAFSPSTIDVAVSGGEVTGQDFRAGQWVWQAGGTVSSGPRLTGIWGDWAVGYYYANPARPALMHYESGAWVLKDASSLPQVQLNGIWGSAPNDIWIVGANHTVLHGDGTDTGWVDVSPTPEISPQNLTAVTGHGNDVWVVGASAAHRWTWNEAHNGGTWTLLPQPGDANCIWISADGEVWIGGYNLISRWSSANTAWVDMGSQYFGAFRVTGIWGSGSNDIWVVGNGSGTGDIWHWNGSSLEWGVGVNPNGGGNVPSLSAVWGSGPNDVWAVGNSGAILHYDGRGLDAWMACSVDGSRGTECAAWQDVTMNGGTVKAVKYNVRAVWGSSPTDVRAVAWWDGNVIAWQ